MARRRLILRPDEYGRCTACNRLTAKKDLRPGPHGGMLGPRCYAEALSLPELFPESE